MSFFLYPILLTLIPLLFLYSKNTKEIRLKDISVIALVLSFSIVTIILTMKHLFGIEYHIVSPISCGLIILFYTPIKKIKRLVSKYFYQYMIQYGFYLLILTAIALWSSFFTMFLNISLSLIVLLIIISILAKSSNKNTDNNVSNETSPDIVSTCTLKDEDKPDVYNILFDAYIGIESLKLSTGFDNSAFYEELKKRGFSIPDKTYSNYHHTAASVPSMMHMDYTDNYLTKNDFESYEFKCNNSRYRLKKMVGGTVPSIFKKLGYKYAITGEPLLDANILSAYSSFIDRYANRSQALIKNATVQAFFGMTILDGIFRHSAVMKQHAEYVYKMMDVISSAAQYDSPKFSFFHIWAPHTPYVFNADGTINEKFSTLNDLTSEDDETKNAYKGNIQYINTLILKALDNLITDIQKRDRSAVIILHSDHGLFKTEKKSSEYNILFATYTYKIQKNNIFPKDMITLVNAYRYLFNGLFGCNFNLLENRFYYENWFAGYYNYQEITSQINKELGIYDK